MEIEIQSQRNNPLLKRTEVYFIVRHEKEGTPNRELVRSELAEKLNVKKENVMVNHMTSTFGVQETVGYAKVYTSVDQAKAEEPDYVLVRNAVITKEERKKEKKPSPEKPKEKPAEKEEPSKKTPAEEVPSSKQPPQEPPASDTAEQGAPKADTSEKTDGAHKSPPEKKEES
jgi:small subunit ribosomal protein S24e